MTLEIMNEVIIVNRNQIERMDYIDVAKGIGIVGVLVGHHLQQADLLIKWIYSFHMPLFFFLTGFLYEKRNVDAADNRALFLKQAKRLLYPYVTFSVLMLAWKYFFHIICGVPYTTGEKEFKYMVLDALTTNGIHALWFLPAMFWASTVYLILRKQKLPGWVLPVFGVATAVLLSQMKQTKMIQESELHLFVNYVARSVLGFSFIVLGALYARIERSGLYVMITSLLVSLIFGLWNGNVGLVASYIGNPLLGYIGAVGGCVFILSISKRIGGTARWLRFLGRNSLVVMATELSFPDEIAWMILGVTKVTRILPPLMASAVMVLLQMVLVSLLILVIQRYAKWMLKLPKADIR